MIICFEGPSAVGKTTLSQALSKDWQIIPEVNLLFQKELVRGKWWYYEKQVERFQRCRNAATNSILDGDVFQPIWYNWIYGYPESFPAQAETHKFYENKMQLDELAFPDLYIVWQTDLARLKKRKEKDPSRKRRNFEKHLQLIEPQRKYFEFLQAHTDISVEFLNNEDLMQSQAKLNEILSTLKPKEIDCIKNFRTILDWLKQN